MMPTPSDFHCLGPSVFRHMGEGLVLLNSLSVRDCSAACNGLRPLHAINLTCHSPAAHTNSHEGALLLSFPSCSLNRACIFIHILQVSGTHSALNGMQWVVIKKDSSQNNITRGQMKATHAPQPISQWYSTCVAVCQQPHVSIVSRAQRKIASISCGCAVSSPAVRVPRFQPQTTESVCEFSQRHYNVDTSVSAEDLWDTTDCCFVFQNPRQPIAEEGPQMTPPPTSPEVNRRTEPSVWFDCRDRALTSNFKLVRPSGGKRGSFFCFFLFFLDSEFLWVTPQGDPVPLYQSCQCCHGKDPRTYYQVTDVYLKVARTKDKNNHDLNTDKCNGTKMYIV